MGNLTSRSQNDSKCRLIAVNMLELIEGDRWHSQMTRMSQFDLKMAICLDNTEQSFARLLREVFLKYLQLNKQMMKELEISADMKK